MPYEGSRGLTPVCEPRHAVSNPHVVILSRGAPMPLPQEEIIFLLLLCNLLGHLSVARREGGVVCGSTLT